MTTGCAGEDRSLCKAASVATLSVVVEGTTRVSWADQVVQEMLQEVQGLVKVKVQGPQCPLGAGFSSGHELSSRVVLSFSGVKCLENGSLSTA